VFWELREIRDFAGLWRRLADHLGGRGVPSLEDALRELELEPVHAAVRSTLAEPAFIDLARSGSDEALVALDRPLAAMAEAVRTATSTTGKPDDVVGVTRARLDRIAATGDEPAGPHDPVAGALADPWHRAVLAGWSVFEPLGGLASTGLTGATSRAWFDELRLAPVVAATLTATGLDDAAAGAAVARVRALLAVPRPSNVGGRTTSQRTGRLVEAWLAHPDVRQLLRVHAWDGVEWFGREEWRELLDWTLLLDRIDGAPDGWPVVKRLLEAADAAGYRADRLRELVAPAKRTRAKVAATPRR
jgi:hypothetical protein